MGHPREAAGRVDVVLLQSDYLQYFQLLVSLGLELLGLRY